MIFVPLNSFAQSLCEQDFSAVENGELIETSIVGNNLVQNAERKLEQDLEIIRSSPKEPLLKKQGFSLGFYLGIDQVREFNRVQEYLQKIKADSKLTHIPYFADQVGKILTIFEKDFKEQNKNDINFLAERLKLLEEFKTEARRRIENQEVTYNWWVNFTLRLALLGTKDIDSHTSVRRDPNNDFINYFNTHENLEENLQDEISTTFFSVLKSVNQIKNNFPEEVMFFPTEANIGIMAFNVVNNQSSIIGLTGKKLIVGEKLVEPLEYYFHDLRHAEDIHSFNEYYASTIKDNDIARRLNNISNQSDREKAEIIFFLFKHENIQGAEYRVRLFNDSFMSHLMDRLKIDFDSAVEYIYATSQKFLRNRIHNLLAIEYQNSSSIKEIKEKTLREAITENDSEEMPLLLNHLNNTSVGRDEESIEKFQNELADVFIEHFSDFL